MRRFPILLSLVLLAGCVDELPLEDRVASFEVSVISPDPAATEKSPLPLISPYDGATTTSVTLAITALNPWGEFSDEFSGELLVHAVPGDITGVSGTNECLYWSGYEPYDPQRDRRTCDGTVPDWWTRAENHSDRRKYAVLPMTNGTATVTVQLGFGYGALRLWVADAGTSTQPGSYATGISPAINFETPTIGQMQRSPCVNHSAFEGRQVTIERGTLVVTGIRTDGFYLTDIDNHENDYNHLFVFNFNRPRDLYPGDQLRLVAGDLQEYMGLSELGHPSWEVVPGVRHELPTFEACATGSVAEALLPLCPVDLATPLAEIYPELTTDARYPNCTRQNARVMDCDIALERLEGARVYLEKMEIKRIDCPPEDPACNTADLDQYNKYAQWPVLVPGANLSTSEIDIVTQENIPGFDPLAHAGERVTLTGHLRSVSFCSKSTYDRTDTVYSCHLCGDQKPVGSGRSNQIWIVEPSTPDDLHLETDR